MRFQIVDQPGRYASRLEIIAENDTDAQLLPLLQKIGAVCFVSMPQWSESRRLGPQPESEEQAAERGRAIAEIVRAAEEKLSEAGREYQVVGGRRSLLDGSGDEAMYIVHGDVEVLSARIHGDQLLSAVPARLPRLRLKAVAKDDQKTNVNRE